MTPRQYLIIPESISANHICDALQKAISENDVACVLVQGDIKSKLSDQISTLRGLCHENTIAVMIEDHVNLAEELDVDGIHLGNNDKAVKEARQKLGETFIIGADAGVSRHTAMLLGEAGADYVAFSSHSIQEIEEMCSWWSPLFQIPCVAFFQEDSGDVNHNADFDFYAVTLKG